jgi:hypothetical protein
MKEKVIGTLTLLKQLFVNNVHPMPLNNLHVKLIEIVSEELYSGGK